MRDPSDDFPAIADLEHRARKRIPHFAWEYLASGTGADQALQRNLDKLAEIRLLPQLLKGPLEPDISTELFGVAYSAPIGIAPVGLTGLIWPGADEALATTAADRRIPYVLSTVATERPEVAGPNAGGMGWYQLYPPRDERIRASMLERAAESGFTALVVTADVPAPSQRERQRKARIRVPPKIGPTLAAQAALCPAWTLALARNGLPRFRGLEAYLDRSTMQKSAGFVGANLGGTLSFAYLAELRELWEGPIIVKGILDPDDAQRCIDVGADAIGVSNHGGRQLDAAPAAIEALPVIVDRVGTAVPVLFDSGVRSGLDVARALALGASFVFCGRAFMFGLGALGRSGAGHALDILTEGLCNVMVQTGCDSTSQLADRLVTPLR
ncbi:MAG TPA: alpha-hydroxy acid oxidase [Acidimicrobiales bacterium]|nr:alpha-hydroxy acid oxidase [Acidimicrobiales bacterium]